MVRLDNFKHYLKSFTLWELGKGLSLTRKKLTAKKVTIQYPEEKTPQSPRLTAAVALTVVVILLLRSGYKLRDA